MHHADQAPPPDFRAIFDETPAPLLLLTPDFVIVHANRARLQATATTLEATVGRGLFEVFPMNPDDPDADGLVNLRDSLAAARDTRRPVTMAIQRYDIPLPDGTWAERYWSPRNVPILDEGEEVVWLLHRSDDITEYVHTREQARQTSEQNQLLRERAAQVDADLFARTRELEQLVGDLARASARAERAAERAEEATRAERAAAAQISHLAEVALAMVDLEDVTDLVTVIAERGLAALGADGGAVAVHDLADPGVLVSYVTASYGPGARADYAHLPLEAALPVCQAARTGTRVLVANRAACLAYSPAMAEVVTSTGSQAFASVPMRADGRVIAVVTAGWETPQAFDTGQVELLEAFAAQCAQALQRLQSRDAERRAGDLARTSAARQGALVAIARALADTDAEEGVLDVVAGQGASLLPGLVWGLGLRSGDGAAVRVLGTEGIDDVVRARVQHLPADFALPVVHSAATGTAYYLPDRAMTAARFAAAGELYTAAGLQASASVPLQVSGGVLLGSLSVASPSVHLWSAEERDLLEAFAGLTAQALARIGAHAAEQAALAVASGIAETLQRSMLTAPPEPDHLQVAVRYAASAAHAEVGGDWYDAFLTSGGLTSLVIGDVTGHDMAAASVMGQLRNLVRGIGFTLGEPPAAVLAAVDRAIAGLGIDTVATAIVAQVEQDEAHRAAGTRVLRWSNAGHLPPLLIEADGATRFLEAEADLVLGWDPSSDRHNHEHVLAPGSTVLLYTDGLIERRGEHLERGLAWLAQAAAELVSASPVGLEELCEGLLALVGEHLDDDVALLALRAHPEDAPRPAQAGPERVPQGLDAAKAAAPDGGGL